MIVLISSILTGCNLTLQKTELEIISRPVAKIYINGQYVGDTGTRYKNNNLKPGEIELEMVPENKQLKPWNYKVKLNNLTTTVVERYFEVEDKYSSGYVMAMEKTGENDQPAILVNSRPADASIKVDGLIKGRTPTKLEKITPGDRNIIVSYPGYENQNLFVKAREGYQIIVDVEMATTKIETPVSANQEPIETDEKEKKVLIKETGTGWLRVRETASSASKEVTKVDSGKKYKLIDNSVAGWYKIEVSTEVNGWVSAEYCQIVEE